MGGMTWLGNCKPTKNDRWWKSHAQLSVMHWDATIFYQGVIQMRVSTREDSGSTSSVFDPETLEKPPTDARKVNS